MKKLVIITGATSGIGLCLAQTFSHHKYPLLLIGRRQENLDNIKLNNCIKKCVDVRDIISFKNAIMEAENIYGDCDLLINNAGLMQLGNVYNQEIDEWNNMIDINLKGVFNGCHLVLEKMKKNKAGTIINMSSIAGKKATAGRAVYCATKFGVSAFSESLRQEVCSDNIRVISICPGIVDTELQQHTNDESYKKPLIDLAKNPNTSLKPQDIADIIFHSYSLPQNICIRELIITPTQQER